MALNLEKVAKLPLPQKLLILGGVVIIIFVLYYIALDTGYQETEQQRTAELTKLKSEIVKIRAIAAEKDKFERENALLEKKLKEAQAKLPNETEIAELLITITDLGRDNGLFFTGFQPGKERAAQLYVRVPISMKFRGNFHHILRFFDEISKLPRIVNISDLKIKSGRAEMLDVSCTAETYKFRDAKTAKKGK
jgi:type IV pilus assembly protein PilO